MTQELKERIMHFDNNSDPFMRYNHVQLTNIDDGFAQVEVPLSEIHLNCWGSPHGGILFSITDIAGGVCGDSSECMLAVAQCGGQIFPRPIYCGGYRPQQRAVIVNRDPGIRFR